jgi:hypothetical protein
MSDTSWPQPHPLSISQHRSASVAGGHWLDMRRPAAATSSRRCHPLHKGQWLAIPLMDDIPRKLPRTPCQAQLLMVPQRATQPHTRALPFMAIIPMSMRQRTPAPCPVIPHAPQMSRATFWHALKGREPCRNRAEIDLHRGGEVEHVYRWTALLAKRRELSRPGQIIARAALPSRFGS